MKYKFIAAATSMPRHVASAQKTVVRCSWLTLSFRRDLG
jgi:hypothetical protein